MFSEIEFQVAAQVRQATLLAEVAGRRRTGHDHDRPNEPVPTARRLQTLIRRIAGAPTFA
jgi:hypothetical protein